jgi:hypothetical protein
MPSLFSRYRFCLASALIVLAASSVHAGFIDITNPDSFPSTITGTLPNQ